MSKNSLLWFSRYGDTTSFSRISGAILPYLSKEYEVTVLSNYENCIKDNIKFVKTGLSTSMISFDEFSYHLRGQKPLEISMKYIMVQITDLIYNNNFKYLIICNGIYESNFFLNILNNNQSTLINKEKNKTKVVLWSPIDYIPSIEIISEALKTDIFFTMTKTMVSEIKKISSDSSIYVLGHGTDIINKETYLNIMSKPHKKVIKELNKLKNVIWTGPTIEANDIIILNANNCKNTNRKRLDITINAFYKLINSTEVIELLKKHNYKIKLWLHTDLETLLKEKIIKDSVKKHGLSHLILSNNKITDYELSLIYKVSSMGLQTSTGEGFSLTNLEGSLFKKLQIVPNFLALSEHYDNDRGLLIDSERVLIKNEANHDITIGLVSENNVFLKLKEALELKINNTDKYNKMVEDAYKYASSLTWSSIASKLVDYLNNFS